MIPQLWRHFVEDDERARFSVGELYAWLCKRKDSKARLVGESIASLRPVVSMMASMPSFRQRLGMRFQDPSKDGTWSMNNLKGYSMTDVGLSKGTVEASWSSDLHVFHLQMIGKSDMEIIRKRQSNTMKARIEKRPRGGKSLASEQITVTAYSRIKATKKLKVERRTANLLPAVILHPMIPSQVNNWTLIYLHGLGSSAFGNYSDMPHLFLDGTIALKVIVPTAPSRELSCFDSWWYKVQPRKGEKGKKPKWKLTQFLSWYDYITNFDGQKEDRIDIDSLLAMRRALHHLIRTEVRLLNGRTDRVILGGKSQGCCTALDAALTFPERLGGFVGCVGHLLSSTPVDAESPQIGIPMHFFHEVEDRIMRWPWVQKAENRLKEAGHSVHSRHSKDPEGNGHFIGGVEGRWVRQALQSICKR